LIQLIGFEFDEKDTQKVLHGHVPCAGFLEKKMGYFALSTAVFFSLF
jgi:hypothetical protein